MCIRVLVGLLLLVTPFLSFGQNDNESSVDPYTLRDSDTVHSLVQGYILESDIEGLFAISSQRFKESTPKDELQSIITQFKDYLTLHNYVGFGDFGNGKTASENDFEENGTRFNTFIIGNTPKSFNQKINPLLRTKLDANFSVRLVRFDRIWLLDGITFEDIAFENAYQIEEYLESFLIDDPKKYKYITRINTYKLDGGELLCQGRLDDLDLKLTSLNRIDSIGITGDQYVSLFIQRNNIEESKTSDENTTDRQWLEIVFADPNSIIITDTKQYGYFQVKGKNNLTDFIEKALIALSKRGYE